MKYFLATYKIFQGEHSEYKNLLIKAQDKVSAEKIAESQEHDAKPRKKIKTWWDYGDGSTIAVYKRMREITELEANTLNQLGGINFFDPKLII